MLLHWLLVIDLAGWLILYYKYPCKYFRKLTRKIYRDFLKTIKTSQEILTNIIVFYNFDAFNYPTESFHKNLWVQNNFKYDLIWGKLKADIPITTYATCVMSFLPSHRLSHTTISQISIQVCLNKKLNESSWR